MTGKRTGFASLQALRGVAALGVVVFHLLPFEAKYLPGPAIMPAWAAAGRLGVDVFFVLSGFVVAWTARTQGGGAEGVRFLLHRLARIYPPYWFTCAALLAAAPFAPGLIHAGAAPGLAATLLLLPSSRPPLLLVSWTLVFEVYFYLGFTALIIMGAGALRRVALLAAWCGAAALLRTLLPPGSAGAAVDVIASPLLLEFAAGVVAAAIVAAAPARRASAAALAVGIGVLTAALAHAPALVAAPLLRVLLFGVGGGLLVLGCAGNDGALRRVLPRALPWFGDISYALYLTHLLAIAVVGRIWAATFATAAPLDHALALALAVAAAILGAWAMHRIIERPLMAATRALIGRPPVRPLAVPA